jgi:O-antigen biosynthesis protein
MTHPLWRSLGRLLGRAHQNRKKSASAGLSKRIPAPHGSGGHIEWVACTPGGDAFVVGWVAHDPALTAWLECADGRRLPLASAFRFTRQDLVDSHHPALVRTRAVDAAFMMAVPGVADGARLRLVLSDGGARTWWVSDAVAHPLPPHPVAAFKAMMERFSPRGRLVERFTKVDSALLAPLRAQQCAAWSQLPVDVHDLGVPVAAPQVSIIVPLYRRMDFVEPQLLKFSRDPWLRAHAEIIYVVDDPTLVEPMLMEAAAWFDLYQVPFRWVWGHANRGFSGANNLGVSVARADRLLFLNSDVFPTEPGWLAPMLEVLAQRPDLGLVAPLLLHTDGTVQHAGMTFRWAHDLGVWTNIHPNQGLDPALCVPPGVREHSTVTGACVLLRRGDLAAVGGWDTGYLIGDFEDSDLCLRLRARGLGCACLNDVRLTHLERQSFSSLGDDGFRHAVVILNAVRQQQRWGEAIAEQVKGASV